MLITIAGLVAGWAMSILLRLIDAMRMALSFGETVLRLSPVYPKPFFVIPAKAGIQTVCEPHRSSPTSAGIPAGVDLERRRRAEMTERYGEGPKAAPTS
jgi:hypothetical protein